MRLTRVNLLGFKTFADKTEVALNAGLVAVVGPNGCGKSNLVDAVLWALGEPNVRALRAGSAAEIIFAGSRDRKPLNYAEVTLTFDNDDRALPIEYSEVSICRRVHRNGEGEYFLNRQACRLKDIVDLFADTGLGRNGYSIVGQREVDAVLSATPEERRMLLDEAAGIQKYRIRKVEALKRLQQAAQHLQRADDVLQEIERERAPLERDAQKAMLYKDLATRLSSLETDLLTVEYADATADNKRLSRLLSEDRAAVGRLDTEIVRVESSYAAIGERIERAERDVDALRTLQHTNLTALERTESRIALVEQRERSLSEMEATLLVEAAALEDRARALEETAKQRTRHLTQSDGSADANARLEAAVEHRHRREDELSKIEADKRGLADRAAAMAEERARNAERGARVDTLRSRLEEAGTRLDSARRDQSAHELSHAQALKYLDDAQRAQEAAEERSTFAGAELSDALSALNAARRSVAEAEGALAALAASAASLDGYYDGVKAVIAAAKFGRLAGDFVPLAEAITVPEPYQIAIEAALGGTAQDIIADTSESAKRAVEMLRETRSGRATFLPLDLMEPPARQQPLQELLRFPGIVGAADEIVQCAEAHRPAVRTVLGHCLVAENLDIALMIAREHRRAGWSRIVTLSGEVVASSGAVSGGRQARTEGGLIKRRADLVAAEHRLARLTELCEAAEENAERCTNARDAASQRRTIAGKAVETARQAFGTADQKLNRAQNTVSSAERSLADLMAELAEAEAHAHAITSHETAFAEVQHRLEKLKKEQEAARAALDDTIASVGRLEAECRERERRVTELKDRAAQESRAAEEAHDAAQGKRMRLAQIDSERTQLERDRRQAFKEREKVSDAQGRAEAQLAQLRERKQSLLQESFAAQEKIKQKREKRAELAAGIHESELENARLEVRRTQVAQRLIEEFEISPDGALVRAERVVIPGDASAQVARLKRELRSLGDVNLGAVEAFDRLQQRHAEMTEQREDLLEAKRQIEDAVREIDRSTRDRFTETLEAVQSAFSRLFARLFEGGEARLTLTEPDNPLETGVEIDVQAPGKKRQRLDLLSGGERSLTATAFLFALFEVKPSPFCILDEVDAALDGRNVERFVELLREFSTRSQFLIVTHNPATIEAADVWYGVTMSEPGISRVIPYRMASAEALVTT